jgi:glycosyltransferase involved in cell wall biosynthesis
LPVKAMAEATPLVSVIMPVRNEAAYIEGTLKSVVDQDYPTHRTEILVVDGMSTDGTRDLVRAAQIDHPQIRLIDNPRLVAAAALNIGLGEARGDYLLRVDGHSELDASYVRRCVEHLQRDGVDCVGGPVEAIGRSPLSRLIAVATSSRFGVGDSAFRTVHDRTMLVDTVNFPSYTRTAIERTGRFDEEIGCDEDDDYNLRLRSAGGTVLLAADVRSRLFCRRSLSALWRQFFRYGFWKVRVLQKSPRRMSARQFVPPLFVAALVVGAAASFTHAGRVALMTLVAAYLLASVAASIAHAPRVGFRGALLPIVFAVLHLSYGSGFLAGLFRFRDGWRKAALEGGDV